MEQQGGQHEKRCLAEERDGADVRRLSSPPKPQASRSHSDASATGRRGLTMRFSPPVEAAFLEGRHSTMCSNFSYVAMIAVFPLLMQFLNHASRWSENIYILRVQCIDAGAELVFASLCAVLPRLAPVRRRLSFVAMEALSCMAVMWFLLRMVMFQPAILRGFLGLPAEALEALEDTKQKVLIVTLGLDAVLTCSHLALPVRWFIMVWLDLLIVVLHSVYAYMAFSALSEELVFDDFYAIIALAAMAACASYGMRTVESRDRLLFATIANERTLRAQAEFSARSQVQDTGSERRPRSNWSSNAVTLFRNPEEQSEGSLAKLVDLGIQEQWIIAKHELNVLQDEVLGTGAHGTVVAGEFCSSLVAIKCYRAGLNMTVFDELRIMRRLRHPNIVLFYGACVDTISSDLKLVLEFVPGIMLNKFIVKMEAMRPESPNSSHQQSVIMGVCQALIYLHSRKPCIVHSDLKPGNIMVERRNYVPVAKLLDFGLSRRVTSSSRPTGGTYRYAAPELVNQETPSPAADVYSLGLVLFYVSSGRVPFAEFEGQQIFRLIQDTQKAPRLDWQPSTMLLRSLQPLIQRCAALAPASRPTVQQAYDELCATPPAAADGQEPLEGRASACGSAASDAAQRDLGNEVPCNASL